MSRPSSSKRARKNPFKHNHFQLNLERLEDRTTPTGITNTISGHVFYDANANGLFDASETAIANNTVQLQNSSGTVIGTATTDANGFYKFTNDQTNLSQDGTLTKTVTFPSTQTNFNLNGMLDQFDPSLGQLQSVEIQHAGSITSEIKVENLSILSASQINGNVSGTLNLLAPGVNDNLAISGSAGSFAAAKYDGITDFGGTSGQSFGQKTASNNDTVNVTDPTALAAYTGTGQVKVTEAANATSNATGGGNVEVNVQSTAQATITVIYHYKTAGPLLPGTYKVVQPAEPAGYTDGLESQGGVVIPNTIGTDFINVTIPAGGGASTSNDFGELKPTGISGFVYFDANNNGVKDANETGIQGVTMTLTGGAAPITATTDANGFYQFAQLPPGTYTVAETQPANYLNGTDTAGTKGGAANNVPGSENIAAITLASGDNGQNYNFGELKPASLAGKVYVDGNNNNKFDSGEPPIPNTKITLTGFDDSGPISKDAFTDQSGNYSFTNLRPGTYAVSETQPVGFDNGATTVGSKGGTHGNDVVSDIALVAGDAGTDYNFGEVNITTPPPQNPAPKDTPPLVGQLGMLPVVSKTQWLNDTTSTYLDPALRGQMAFVVGASVTLTGANPSVWQTMAVVNQLDAGLSSAQYIQQLSSTDAHRAIQASNVYESLLGRAPTAAELSAAVTTLNTTGGQIALSANVYASTGYAQLHPTSQALADALNHDILNVAPGAASSQSLLQSMANEPLGTVIHDLLYSDASLGNFIDTTYRQTVRRPASAAEISTWTSQLKANTITLDDLSQRLLASQEFYQLAYISIK